jgi:hypothetical protein
MLVPIPFAFPRLTPVKELHDGTDASNCAIASNFSRSSNKCRSKSSLRRSHWERIKQTSHGGWIYNGQSHLFHCVFPSLCCCFGWYCSWKCRFGHSESTFTGMSLIFWTNVSAECQYGYSGCVNCSGSYCIGCLYLWMCRSAKEETGMAVGFYRSFLDCRRHCLDCGHSWYVIYCGNTDS